MKMPERKRIILIGLSVAITQWANDRRIIAEENAKGQFMKLVSEFGEVCNGIREDNDVMTQDGIGDTFVMLNNVAAIMGGDVCGLMNIPCFPSEKLGFFFENVGLLADYVAKRQDSNALETIGLLANCLVLICEDQGFDFIECVELAYNEIKHRRGVMYNGVFVKEDDPRYHGIMKELEVQDLEESRV